jgi:hypothetical protein
MKPIMIGGAVLLLSTAGPITEGAGAAEMNTRNSKAQAAQAEVVTVSGSAEITGIIEECPPCADPNSPPFACFEGSLSGDLGGTFQSAMFKNPFLPPGDAPEAAILDVCSIIFLDTMSSEQLKAETLETEDRIFARKSEDPSGFGFYAVGELLTVVGGGCQGLITLLGDALGAPAPYVGRLICSLPEEGLPPREIPSR